MRLQYRRRFASRRAACRAVSAIRTTRGINCRPRANSSSANSAARPWACGLPKARFPTKHYRSPRKQVSSGPPATTACSRERLHKTAGPGCYLSLLPVESKRPPDSDDFPGSFLERRSGFRLFQDERRRSRQPVSGSHPRQRAAADRRRLRRAGAHHPGWRKCLGILLSERPALSARTISPDQRIVRPGRAHCQRGFEAGSSRKRSITFSRAPGSMRISMSGSAPQEDNKAWEYLLRARQKFDEARANVPEENRRLAFEELLIAEGSDWCWWYGPEHQSENRREFDELYRQHLANVYRALRLPAARRTIAADLDDRRARSSRASRESHPSGHRWRSHFLLRVDGRRDVTAPTAAPAPCTAGTPRCGEFYYGTIARTCTYGWIFKIIRSSTEIELRTRRSRASRYSIMPLFVSPSEKFWKSQVPLHVLGIPRRTSRSVFSWRCSTAICRSTSFRPRAGSNYFRLEYLFRADTFQSAISLAEAGGGVLPITMSRLDIALPYSSLFQSSSGRSVAPCSEMPANSPRDRE